ncbi:HAMP domain-containing histidine kinase [Methanoplanus sp. FWC-SCC4]|uniref:histidine kinase n=1 Tax=Methanochimaera problematica TaxID=2609417 RepID=A0AA97FCR4_9EURY|nr:HAMP domain-containing sensor histidine kinase [Methanoplanus sp. FWC-SCC4]WOF17095.1 HAMP domain-containing histidine kinase [Methanoplanus sp. FWC-SCC4]
MTVKKNKDNYKLSLISYLLIAIIIIIAPLFAIISFIDYNEIKNDFNSNYNLLQNNTENSIMEAIELSNKGLLVYDKTLDEQMRSAFIPFFEEYYNKNQNPEEMDLEFIKEKLGDNYELYIINKNQVIIKTTKEEDMGLDFKAYSDFSNYLDEILQTDGYSGDRVVRGLNDLNTVSKYSYYPTPDHNYILELSYEIKDYDEIRSHLKYSAPVEDLKGMNPYLKDVALYDIFGYTIKNADETSPEILNMLKEQILQNENNFEVTNEDEKTVTRYRYTDLYDPEFGSNPSVVVGFTYSKELIETELNKMVVSKFASFILIFALIIMISYVVSTHVAMPVKTLAEDTDTILKGDLERKIKTGGPEEIISLQNSISEMVNRLKNNISVLEEQKKTILIHNQELESLIDKRTNELRTAGEDADFFLDIMTHDINNANMAALGFAEYLNDSLSDDLKIPSEKIIASIKHSDDIIKNVSTIRKIREKGSQMKFIDLDETINKVIRHFPDINISFEESGQRVIANELLTEVFSNILGNSQKYAGKNCNVKIYTKEQGDRIKIIIEDDGPGIPDEMKNRIFEKFLRNLDNKNRVSGKGIGLYIVHDLVALKYGGEVYAEDKIPGEHENGLRICVILKKG